jgi:hypothetical protein
MATDYPNDLDDFTNPSAGDQVTTPGAGGHAGQHTDANDAIEAVQARVGVTGSAVQTTVDFQLSDTSGGHDHDGVNSRTISGVLTSVSGTNFGTGSAVHTSVSSSNTLNFRTFEGIGGTSTNINGNILEISSSTGLVTSVDDEKLQVVNGDLRFSDNMELTMCTFFGAALETIRIVVSESAGQAVFELDQSGSGDLTFVFSDGYYVLDTTPAASIALTQGSDTSPQLNYVYVDQATKALTGSTVSFPSTEFAPIATVLVQTAASIAASGAYKVHAWTDHTWSSGSNGHLSHINSWIRKQNATWESGVDQTLTITTIGGDPDNVIFTTASGQVLQLHDHIFPAFAAPTYYIANDSVTPYTETTDLNTLLTDSTGASMSNRFFSLVIWGCVSEETGDCKLFVNLPDGSYQSSDQVTTDAQKYANYTIPAEFKGTGFLISELKLRHQPAGGGTWTSIQEVDLRGFFPSVSAGAGAGTSSEFIDNVFRIQDETDVTKEIAFEASNISTGTTRTITVPDFDLTLINSASVASDVNALSSSLYFLSASNIFNDSTSVQGSTVSAALDTLNTGVSAAYSGGTLNMNSDDITNAGSITYGSLQSVTSSEGIITLDWSVSNKLLIDLTQSLTAITMSNPPGATNVQIMITQTSAAYTITASAWNNVIFKANTPPTITATSGAVDFLTGFFDDRTGLYYLAPVQDFRNS